MSYGTLGDADLVARASGLGDRGAFGELVLRHQSVVRSVLTRLTQNRTLADDLAQDVFLRAFNKLGQYDGRGSFRGWLCTLAYREFLQARRKRGAIEKTLETYRSDPALAPSPCVSAHSGASLDLDRALGLVSDAERDCVVLCYGAGLSHSEAAETTGLPVGTVKSHIARALKKMRAGLVEREEAKGE